MHELTPDSLARIASQMLNMLPTSANASLPEIPSIPSAAAAPSPIRPQSFELDPSTHGIPSIPEPPLEAAAASPSLAPASPTDFAAAPPFAWSPPSGTPAVAPTPAGMDGLRAFVQRIQAPGAPRRCDLAEKNLQIPGVESLGASLRSAVGSASRPFDVSAIRRDFPILAQNINGRPLAWLDNAATTQKPISVIEAVADFYRNDNSNIHRGAHSLAARATDAYELARERTREFLHAGSVNEIIFVRGTTEGINLIARTYGTKFLQPGDEIVLSVLEHHANIVPWQMVAREKNAVLRVIPVNDRGEVMMEAYDSLLGPRTRIVALTHASNSLGTLLPIEEMTRMAKRYGARVLIDGAQTIAHTPIDVQQIDCDFFVFSGHKVFAPTGIGAVYAKEELQEIMPPWQGGGNMIRRVTFEETTYADPPARFEAGTPSIGDAVGLRAALDYVNQLGPANIAEYERRLLDYGTEKLSRIDGLRIIGTAREKIGVLSFVIPGVSTEEIGKRLDQEGIAVRAGHHCAQPSLRRFGLDATVRPSLSIYNTTEELDRLADALRRIRQRSIGVAPIRN